MSVLKYARTVIAAAAISFLPVHAVAAAPVMPALASAAVVQDDDDDGNPFFSSEYLVPAIIVIALAVGLYFALSEEDEDEGPRTSP